MWRLSLCHTMKAFNCKRFKQTFIWSCHILLIKLVTHNSGLKLFTFTLILTPKSATTSLRSWMLCGSCTSPKQADANKTKSHAFFFFLKRKRKSQSEGVMSGHLWEQRNTANATHPKQNAPGGKKKKKKKQKWGFSGSSDPDEMWKILRLSVCVFFLRFGCCEMSMQLFKQHSAPSSSSPPKLA